MGTAYVILSLGILIVIAHLCEVIFRKTRIPSVLILMLIGLLIGPVLHFIAPGSFGKAGDVFTTVTLVCILFGSGAGLNIDTIRDSLGKASLLTLLNFLGMLIICVPFGRFVLGLDWLHSLYLGAAVGGTSSAIVIPMVNQLKPGPRAGTMLLLESTLSDVLCLAVALSLMQVIESGTVNVWKSVLDMLVSVAFAAVVGFALGRLWLVALKRYLKGMQNPIFTSFALAFIIYGLCELVGLNGGLAVLSYGISLGNSGSSESFRRRLRPDEELDIDQKDRDFFAEVIFVMQTYFFVYIGINLQLDNLWHIAVGAVIAALALAWRHFSARLTGGPAMDRRDRRLLATLGPKGLVAAVLATIPLQHALETGELPHLYGKGVEVMSDALLYGTTVRDVAYAVVLISIVASSLLVIFGEKRNR